MTKGRFSWGRSIVDIKIFKFPDFRSGKLLALLITSNGKKLIIDSGATCTFVSLKMPEILWLCKSLNYSPMFCILLASGVLVESNAVARLQLDLEFKLQCSIQYLVVPNLSCQLILGLPWLNYVNPTINWTSYFFILWNKYILAKFYFFSRSSATLGCIDLPFNFSNKQQRSFKSLTLFLMI